MVFSLFHLLALSFENSIISYGEKLNSEEYENMVLINPSKYFYEVWQANDSCTPPLVSNGSACVNKPTLGETCNNENNNGCRDDYLILDTDLCKSRGVIGEQPLIENDCYSADGDTTLINGTCSYIWCRRSLRCR